jgi:hypothetical protein
VARLTRLTVEQCGVPHGQELEKAHTGFEPVLGRIPSLPLLRKLEELKARNRIRLSMGSSVGSSSKPIWWRKSRTIYAGRASFQSAGSACRLAWRCMACTRMAMHGVLPPEDPVYLRVDPAVDVVYEDPADGHDVLEALRYARWPYRWYAEFQGAPPYTTVAIKSKTKIVGRVYCRNTKLRNGNPRWGKLRFEREQRFEWRDRRPLSELAREVTASTFWGSVFGYGAASGKVTRIEREAQTVKLVERVRLVKSRPGSSSS